MAVMVFDVGGSEIKYCVMDDSLERGHYGSVPTPLDSREHFFQVLENHLPALCGGDGGHSPQPAGDYRQ